MFFSKRSFRRFPIAVGAGKSLAGVFMHHFFCAKRVMRGVCCISLVGMLMGCMDSSYDINKIDATLGLGSDGLKVKFGNSEKVYLKDIIDTDGNTKLDANNQFYLTERGTTELSYQVDEVSADVAGSTRVNSTYRVLDNDILASQMGISGVTDFSIPAGYSASGIASGTSTVSFVIERVGSEVKRITRVYPHALNVSLVVGMECSNDVRFDMEKLVDFSVEIPDYVHLSAVPNGWKLNGQTLYREGEMMMTGGKTTICTLPIDYIDLKDGGVPVNGTIRLAEEDMKVGMHGTVYFKTRENFTMHSDSYADAVMDVVFSNNGHVSADSIRGVFSPSIDPEVNPIEISANLPDFLKDEATRIKVSNPTLRFNADMRALPANVNFAACLTSVKSGKQGWQTSVDLPQVTLSGRQENVVYYHRSGSTPYDPDAAVTADAIVQRVDNLGTLIETLPDCIEVDLKNGKVGLTDDEITMRMGHTYRAKADYSVFVPLEVEQGFKVVYRDSTESVSDDLEDVSAHGVRLNTVVENTVPLALKLEVIAYGKDGRPVSGVNFTKADVAAGQGDGKAAVKTSVQVDADLQNPTDLSKIDYFLFVITAHSADGTQSQKLTSTQYIRLTDVRLRLKGQVVVDLN